MAPLGGLSALEVLVPMEVSLSHDNSSEQRWWHAAPWADGSKFSLPPVGCGELSDISLVVKSGLNEMLRTGRTQKWP